MTNVKQLDYHQLSELSFDLWATIGRGTATAEDQAEYHNVSEEIDRRDAEHAQFLSQGGGFIPEADMARWGIQLSDCIDYPSY